MYSTYNEGKSVAAESSQNTVHRTTNMKPIDVTSNSYAEYNGDSNKNP